MKSRKIYLLRHGEIEKGNEKRYIGRLDLPLSVAGRQQAARLRDYLAKLEIEAVYCSDLSRAGIPRRLFVKSITSSPYSAKGCGRLTLESGRGKPSPRSRKCSRMHITGVGRICPVFSLPGGRAFINVPSGV